MSSDRLGRTFAVVLGLGGLLLGYLLWVLEIDGLHTRPPSVVGALVAAPLWTLFPLAVCALVGYALGTPFERPGRPSGFERRVAAVFAVPALPVAWFALSSMFFGNETSGPSVLLTVAVYPDVLLLATLTAGAFGYLFGLGGRALGEGLRSDPAPDTPDETATAPDPGDSPARDPTRGRRTATAPGAQSAGGASTTAGSGAAATDTATAATGAAGANAADRSTGGSSPGGSRSGRGAGGSATGGREGTSDAGWPGPVPGTPSVDASYADIDRGERLDGPPGADAHAGSIDTPEGPVSVRLVEPRVDGTLHTDDAAALLDAVADWERLAEHDHVVDVVASGSDPLPWVATERLDAGRLDRYAGELPFEASVRVGLAVVGAIRYAHRRGVTHERLHPGAVGFRATEAGPPAPKVDDWGLSRALESLAGSAGPVAPAYTAPEQFDDSLGDVGEPTDVYRAAATLYALFTGEPPVAEPDADPAAAMRAALAEEPRPPSAVESRLMAAVDDALLPALATDPGDRPEALVYLRDDLRGLLEG